MLAQVFLIFFSGIKYLHVSEDKMKSQRPEVIGLVQGHLQLLSPPPIDASTGPVISQFSIITANTNWWSVLQISGVANSKKESSHADFVVFTPLYKPPPPPNSGLTCAF